jgi:hypothetical protein
MRRPWMEKCLDVGAGKIQARGQAPPVLAYVLCYDGQDLLPACNDGKYRKEIENITAPLVCLHQLGEQEHMFWRVGTQVLERRKQVLESRNTGFEIRNTVFCKVETHLL